VGIITIVGQHSETLAEGSGSDKQVDWVHTGGLTAVNQVSLDLTSRSADPVMQLHLDIGTGELTQVNRS
jgi:hypothetical protein